MKTQLLIISVLSLISLFTLADESQCYQNAYSSSGANLSKNESIELCRDGGSLATVQCYQNAYSSSGANLSKVESLDLCKQGGTLATVKCYQNAYSSSGANLSKAESLDLCSKKNKCE